MSLIFKPKSLIEFIGDSITDFHRMDPAYQPLGNGYVHDIHRLLQTGYPELQLKVVNKGISGDRVTSLKARWNTDVLDVNPDYLFIYIGTNDVWRFFEGPREEAVALPEYTKIYRQLISSAKTSTQAKIYLISPFLAETNPMEPFRKRLADYQQAIDLIGNDVALPVIHLQPAFDWAMLSKPSCYWTVDRVHPTPEGNMLIAITILRAAGFSL